MCFKCLLEHLCYLTDDGRLVEILGPIEVST